MKIKAKNDVSKLGFKILFAVKTGIKIVSHKIKLQFMRKRK